MSDASSLQPYSHEEADTRIILHTNYFAACGMTLVIVRTTNTNVIVSAFGNAQKILQRECGYLGYIDWCWEELQAHSSTLDSNPAWIHVSFAGKATGNAGKILQGYRIARGAFLSLSDRLARCVGWNLFEDNETLRRAFVWQDQPDNEGLWSKTSCFPNRADD